MMNFTFGLGRMRRKCRLESSELSTPSWLSVTCRRGVISTHERGGLIKAAENSKDGRDIVANLDGRLYGNKRKLWSHKEALERDMTRFSYSPAERSPPSLLPIASGQRKNGLHLTAEGSGARTLLLDLEEGTLVENSGSIQEQSSLSEPVAVNDLILKETDDEMAQSSLASLKQAKDLVAEDLQSSGLGAQAPWESVKHLDPMVRELARRKLGPLVTRVQSRLLPALLHPDHNDVIMNGVTGSGKTWALLLAILNGLRTESSGLNVIIAKDLMMVRQIHDHMKSLCGEYGGRVVDRDVADMQWMLAAADREDLQFYYSVMRKSVESTSGSIRFLVTTADIFTDLLFEKKMQFEPFGYLRRVYVDDVGPQVDLPSEYALTAQVRDRLRDPTAIELSLSTLHQMASPEIRSVLQLGCVSADLDSRLNKHLKALCIKETAHTTIMSAVRLPSTLHCLFSFYLHKDDPDAYLVQLLRNAASTIPGRAVIFVPKERNMMECRIKLRKLGLDAKLYSEVYDSTGTCRKGWKFMLLHEDGAFGVDLPLVSHVFITFPPSSWMSYQHMSGRTARLGNVGWVYVVCDQRKAKDVHDVVSELDVNMKDHVLSLQLQQIPSEKVHSMVKDPTPYGLDPQFVVQNFHEYLAEDPVHNKGREFFSPRNVLEDFFRVDYTPLSLMHRSATNAAKIEKEIMKNPSMAHQMQKAGLLDKYFRPTPKLKRTLQTEKL